MQKVLVVENSPTITKLLSHFLVKAGCEVVCTENGLDALVALDSFLPDIILTDIIMPKISGDQLCKIIRSEKKLQGIFLVVHSSITVEDKDNLLDLDADMYISKGSSRKYKELIAKILDQHSKGIRRNKVVIGTDELNKRDITAELLLARRHYKTIFENITDAVLELDRNGKIIQLNTAAENLFRKNTNALLSTSFIDYLSGESVPDVVKWLDNVDTRVVKRFESKYDEPLLVGHSMVTLNMVSLVDDGELFIIVILQNITAQKMVEARLEDTLSELDVVIESIDYGVCFFDKNLRIRFANRAFRDLWDVTDEQVEQKQDLRMLMQHNMYNYLVDVPEDEFYEYVEARVARVLEGSIGPLELQRTDGLVLQYQCIALPDGGRMISYYDITDLKRTQDDLATTLEKVSALANHDPLTKLANLRLAKERIQMSLASAKRQKLQVAVMFVDLDGFKSVNDTLGHEAGDEVLIMVADRLKNTLRGTDTVARIGGDEFLIIQTEVKERGSVELVAEKVISSIKTPFEVNGEKAHIGASVGIAMYPVDGDDGPQLIKCADNVMYQVKGKGKNNYMFASKAT